jgi:hypothetical protein
MTVGLLPTCITVPNKEVSRATKVRPYGDGILPLQYCMATAEWWTGENLEGSDRGLVEVMLRNFPGGSNENNEKPVSIVYVPTEIRTQQCSRTWCWNKLYSVTSQKIANIHFAFSFRRYLFRSTAGPTPVLSPPVSSGSGERGKAVQRLKMRGGYTPISDTFSRRAGTTLPS